ncbi:hypothetical protein EV1_007882 [Malus domestica]
MWKSSSPKRPINDLLSNIHHLMPMKLEGDSNFDVWKYQMAAILGAYDLMGYVDVMGNRRSDMFWAADEAIWCREDQAVMAAINATLSPSVLEQVCDCTTSRQLWGDLHGRFWGKNLSFK